MPGSGSLLYSSDYSSLAGFLAFSLSHGTVIHQQFCWPSFKTHPALTTCPRLHHHSSQSTLLASPPELPYYFQTALPAAVPARHAMLSKMVLLNIGHAILLQPPITPAWQKKKKKNLGSLPGESGSKWVGSGKLCELSTASPAEAPVKDFLGSRPAFHLLKQLPSPRLLQVYSNVTSVRSPLAQLRTLSILLPHPPEPHSFHVCC